MSWHTTAYELLLREDYTGVAEFYEQAIEAESETLTHYWYLGLAYLLQAREEEAQTTWFFTITQGTPEEVEQWTEDLIQVLETEAQRQKSLNNNALSWLIRRYILELDPTRVNNLLRFIQLAIILNQFTPAFLNEYQILNLLRESEPESLDLNLLLEVLVQILEFPSYETLAFAEICSDYLSHDVVVTTLKSTALQKAYRYHLPIYATDLVKICIKLQPHNLALLKDLFGFYLYARDYSKAIDVAHQFLALCDTVALQVFGNYQLLQALMSSGDWLAVAPIAQRHKEFIKQLVEEKPPLEPLVSSSLLATTSSFLYLQDNLVENRWLLNQIAQLFQQHFAPNLTSSPITRPSQARPLRIGYIAHTLKKHSVGWLSRWLFHYHNREAFTIAIYLVNQGEDELTHTWFRQNATIVHNLEPNASVISQKIQEDQIDILVDLDSITLDITCQVMALKPAPIQVTWLGLDASGIPTVDYFIADPYVLPDNAQEHYSETIVRLPETYIAVDGFEVGVPTLRRELLGIPHDAVIYLSVQNGFKRNPEIIRLQLQIIKAVPNSYLLIKGIADDKVIQKLVTDLAVEVGVETTRLRFLHRDSSELIHRANLQIADVVLDTYPYNGATTTLETLWMGIPIVTRVGQQFAARNSYTFMMNAGVTEGIAWTDEEYIEWGIKLGKDEKLRQEVHWQLKQSRKTSPLWNAKNFTRKVEKLYQQMCKNFETVQEQ